MIGRGWISVAIVLAPLALYPLIVLADGAPRFPTRAECERPAVDGQPVDVVFARFDNPTTATAERDRVVGVGFIGTEALPDGCGRWKVVLRGVPTLEVAAEVQREASTVDLRPTLELASEG